MLKLLQRWLHTQAGPAQPAGEGRRLRLPAGTILAEQGLAHQRDASGGHTVMALLDEAYVVLRLDLHCCWYATWQPYLGSWELLHLDEEEQAAAEEAPALSARVLGQ
jgi:hypothetical protein